MQQKICIAPYTKKCIEDCGPFLSESLVTLLQSCLLCFMILQERAGSSGAEQADIGHAEPTHEQVIVQASNDALVASMKAGDAAEAGQSSTLALSHGQGKHIISYL